MGLWGSAWEGKGAREREPVCPSRVGLCEER